MNFNFFISIAFGGLLGSLITIIVKAFIDEKQKRNENKRILKKIYFENKLKAAEKAISIYYSTKTHFNSLAGSMNSLSKEDTTINETIFNNSIKVLNENLTKLSLLLNEGGHSIVLYHDIDTIKHWGDNDNQIFIELFSECTSLNEDLLHYADQLDKVEPSQKPLLDSLIQENIKKLRLKIKELSDYYKKAELFYNEAIVNIRKEILLEIS